MMHFQRERRNTSLTSTVNRLQLFIVQTTSRGGRQPLNVERWLNAPNCPHQPTVYVKPILTRICMVSLKLDTYIKISWYNRTEWE